jgi:hypothetical protein
MRTLSAITFGAALLAAGPARAGEPATDPRPVPLTRPTMKQFLEDVKARTPRIPLPPLTDEEKAKLGERGIGYEARIRALYMPGGADGRSGFGFGSGKEPEPGMTLDYKFKTQLFWIVSRTNNCQY